MDVVVASKAPFGVVTYQHSKPLPLALNKESPGLQQLVATVTASAEASGYHDAARVFGCLSFSDAIVDL